MGTVHDLFEVRDLRGPHEGDGWFWVEQDALRHVLALIASGRLLPTDLVVYMALCAVADTTSVPTRSFLARRTGQSLRTMSRALHRLEGASLVRRVWRPRGGFYRVMWAPQEP